MEQQEQKREYKEVQPGEVKIEAAGDDYPEYVKVDAEEPFKAHITKFREGTRFNKKNDEDEPRWFYWFELDEGPGKGQEYRGDFFPKLSKTGNTKLTNLSKFVQAVTGELLQELDPMSLIGKPVRIELSEPWGDKQMQFVNTYKKPTADQKAVKIKPKDVVATAEEVDEVMEQAGAIFEGATEVK